MYAYPELRVVKRVRFSSIRKRFPRRFGLLDDPRLGFHHSALSTRTV